MIHAHDPYYDDDHIRALGFEPWSFEDGTPVRVAILQAGHAVYREKEPDAIPGLELILDGRNVLDRDRYEAAGVRHVGIGR